MNHRSIGFLRPLVFIGLVVLPALSFADDTSSEPSAVVHLYVSGRPDLVGMNLTCFPTEFVETEVGIGGLPSHRVILGAYGRVGTAFEKNLNETWRLRFPLFVGYEYVYLGEQQAPVYVRAPCPMDGPCDGDGDGGSRSAHGFSAQTGIQALSWSDGWGWDLRILLGRTVFVGDGPEQFPIDIQLGAGIVF